MNIRLLRGATTAVGLCILAAACDSVFVDPADDSTTISLELVSGSAGGPAEAFDKADAVVIRAADGTQVRFNQSFSIRPAGQSVRIPLEMRLRSVAETLTFSAEVSQANAPLFRGTEQFRLRVGRRTAVTIQLQPVANALVMPQVPTLTAYGDTVKASGAVVFATGDTLTVGAVEWTSLSPTVIAIQGGVPIAQADGDAQLIARQGNLTATVNARVFAQVTSIRVDPPTTDLQLFATRQYTATPLDRRGNPIPNRRVTWASSNPLAITVDSTGRATSRGVGTAQITVTSDGVVQLLTLRGLPGSPVATTDTATNVTQNSAQLNATVQPSGAPTDTWFEFSTDSTFTDSDTTSVYAVAAGLNPVDVSLPVGQLAPATTYFVRAFVRNTVGIAVGEVTKFTTRTAVIPVVATTGPVQFLDDDDVVLTGTLSPTGVAVTGWFEWGTDSLFIAYDTTQALNFPSATGSLPLTALLENLAPGIYYYRAVGRTGTTTVRGQRRFFIISGPGGGGPAPTVVTHAASSITTTSAVLNGSVNPSGISTSVWFEWDTDPAFGSPSTTAPFPVGSGSSTLAVAQIVSPLAPNTTYYFRIVARTGTTVVNGNVVSFTTTTSGSTSPPSVTTVSAGLTSAGADLTGLIVPNGAPTTAFFEWGTDPSLGTSSTTASEVISGGTGDFIVHSIGSLAPNTTYYYRAVGSNAGGTTRGAILSFTTPPVATPLAPTVTTTAASVITTNSGVLNGSVNPNGDATTAWFEWGTDPSLAVHATTTAAAVGSGSAAAAFGQSISSLAPGTTYYYRIAASNTQGTSRGSILSFATTPMVGPSSPTVTTTPATALASDSAVAHGSVNPNGNATTAWFEWGTDPTLMTFTATAAQAVGAGSSALPVSAGIRALTPGTQYYFRAAASNSSGTVRGAILSFTTTGGGGSQPIVTTGLAAPVRGDSAVVNGTANPNGSNTTAWFEWGTDPLLATYSSTDTMAIGAGTTAIDIAALLTSLTPGTTYYYRIAANNGSGTVRGSIQSFTPSSGPSVSPPSAITAPAELITVSGVLLRGNANPNGLITAIWFEWGTSPTLSTYTRTPLQFVGPAAVPLQQAFLTGLTGNTTYYYRIVAINADGSASGTIRNFITK